ncbi:hypothetical protein [Chryseobacterium sp. 2987]|uniref:hypothetical protein n=1 Tax=Chryseobacterium sp. 2987 TaxID=2817767 RepID=UPI00285B6FC9|nr:hypothetical protein [Chryseobacterium sp. 2987]MDR6923085.1 hypothetical protein [Chryseobacterium sp. 2987]
MKKILITLLAALSVAAFVLFLKKDPAENNGPGILLLPFAVMLSIPVMKFLFPATKELKIGTLDFYPNLVHKTVDFLKKKRRNK